MSYPSVKNFGIVDNPLVDSPFTGHVSQGGAVPPLFNNFLLLNGDPLDLLDGSDFLLLSST